MMNDVKQDDEHKAL